MFVGKLGTFVALGVRGSGMIENRSFNLVGFYVKMGKTSRYLPVKRCSVMALSKVYLDFVLEQLI